jgi:hypothetical protein
MHTITDQAPDKDEISNAYAAAYLSGNDLLFYFGADRFANNGDSQIGFWFFQNSITLNPNGTFSGVHAVGDLLVLSDFTRGGRISTIKVFEWVGSGVSDGTLDLIASGVDCTTPGLSGDDVCATVNSGTTDAPWPYMAKFPPPAPNANNFPRGSFYEGGINVSALLGGVPCFSSFLAETRSSQSVSAQLKDFALGEFALCDARISIAPDATNEVNTDHELTITVEKKDSDTNFVFASASGVEATASLTNSDGASATFVGGNTCTTSGNGTCTVTINSPTAGSTTISATAEVTLSDGAVLTRTTDGTAGNTGPATKLWVDAQIDLSPPTDTNEVNEEHTVTVTVQQDDGQAAGGDETDGFGPAPDGTLVSFNLINNTAGATFVGGNTCNTSGGSCTVQINTSTAGSVDIHATTTFSVGGVSLTRATGTGGLNSADANKVYVDAQIDLSPLTDTNSVNEAHTLTATVLQDDGLAAAAGGDGVTGFGPAPNGTQVIFSLLNNTAGASFVGGNTCNTNGGSCTVQINTGTAGSVDIHATTTFSVGGVSLTRATGTGGLNSADANKVYVAGSLRWLKHNGSGAALGGATFEVCRTHNFDSGALGFVDILDVCVTVLDNSPPDADPDPGEFQLNGLTLGRYTIEETVPPPGFQGDPFVGTLELTVATVSVTASHIWVNTSAGEGCTPGFWKNHTSLWDGIPPDETTSIQTTDSFNATFGVNFAQSGLLNSVNLLAALSVSGNDLMALNRHAAAALVNADSGISFGFSVGQVIALYRDAVGAVPGPETIASALATLSAANEQGCPLR